MSVTFRILLLIIALFCSGFMMARIRKARLRIESSIFWVIFSIILAVMAIFPGICSRAAKILGVQSPANLVFAFIIFLLLIKLFSQTIQISSLEEKLQTIARKIALEESERDEK